MDELNNCSTAQKHNVKLERARRRHSYQQSWWNKGDPDTVNTDETAEPALENHVVINEVCLAE